MLALVKNPRWVCSIILQMYFFQSLWNWNEKVQLWNCVTKDPLESPKNWIPIRDRLFLFKLWSAKSLKIAFQPFHISVLGDIQRRGNLDLKWSGNYYFCWGILLGKFGWIFAQLFEKKTFRRRKKISRFRVWTNFEKCALHKLWPSDESPHICFGQTTPYFNISCH